MKVMVMKMARYSIRVKDIMENYYILKEEEQPTTILDQAPLSEDNDTWDNPFNTNYQSPFDKSQPTVDEVINSTWQDLFNFTYPKLPDYKEGELETKIIKAYYMREIGFETVERFKLALNETLNRIMPYYIELYKSISLQGDNPLENVDLIDHSDRATRNTNTNNTTSSVESNGNSKQVFEDTPSNELGPDTNYATNITTNNAENTDKGSSESEGTSDTDDTYDRHVHGLQGYSKQDLIARYRENIINVDELIILELRDLFMLLY